MTDASDPTRTPDPAGATGELRGELDGLLDAWAARHQLDAQDADRLLAGILGPDPATTPVALVGSVAPAALPATWWAQLSQQVAAAVVLGTSRPANVASAA
jgi:hypothetical protein